MKGFAGLLPGLVVGMAGLYLVLEAVPPGARDGEMDLDAFGKIPVMQDGRVKPFDTVARSKLIIISNKQTFRGDKGKSQPAIKWLLDVMTSGDLGEDGPAQKAQVFRVDNDQLLGMLGLEIRPEFFRYSINEMRPKFEQLQQQVDRLKNLNEKQWDAFDQKVFDLYKHLEIYVDLALRKEPLAIPPDSPDGPWRSYSQVKSDAMHAAMDQLRSEKLEGKLDTQKLSEDQLFALVQARTQKQLARQPAAESLMKILDAYREGKADQFNRAVADYQQFLNNVPAGLVARSDYELFFNRFEPFYHCSVLYVVVFFLACFSWLGWFSEPINRCAFWLAVLTLVVHTWALLSRMYIQNRPPVTNLYSAAVFVGWGALVLALILEWLFGNGIGNVAGAVAGFATMLVAHHISLGGDTLENMRAVLDTNFWLATHVTVVTLGYAATFMAGLLGILYVILGVFTPKLDRSLSKRLAQMIYGVLCFATLLSFTGTVLGGLWADQSWGRFWGWDPKENGALIIVVWNALILHARWAGIIKQRGMAVMAIVGNIVTGWSMFGTNQLGVGLHSYGFNKTLTEWLVRFWISQLIVIGIGLVPLRFWRSMAAQRQAASKGHSESRDRKAVVAISPST
jgi:ABC-type transport system involved in cytochrome c biogenesis permease subunit